MKNTTHTRRLGLLLVALFVLCQLRLSASNYIPKDTIWPGDANNDGIVNEQDILYIGLAFGTQNVERATVSNAFKPDTISHYATGHFRNGVNFATANCNGDSLINFMDTVAVDSNFGLKHSSYTKPDTTACPEHPNFLVRSSSHTAKPGQTITIDIFSGDLTHRIDSIYGLSFELQLDTALVNKKKAGGITFQKLWLGSGASGIIQYSKNMVQTKGIWAVAVTSVYHPKLNLHNCFGACDTNLVCSIDIVIEDNLSGGVHKFDPKIKNLTGLTANENHIKFNIIDSAQVTITGTLEPIAKSNTVKQERLTDGRVRFVSTAHIHTMVVTNMLGQTLQSNHPGSLTADFNPSKLPAGMYAVALYFDDGSRITVPIVVAAH
jgi:hypothetical protein